jgi:hypothetical protein
MELRFDESNDYNPEFQFADNLQQDYSHEHNLDYHNYYDHDHDDEFGNTPVEKYWETKSNHKKHTDKKKVSFTDIMSNMNLVVSKNGVLQKITPIQTNHNTNNSNYGNYSNNSNNSNYDPNINHSYIYNKYFKDYHDSTIQNDVVTVVPKTREEYIQILIEERIKKIQEKKRISQIKSTKLLFTSDNQPKITPVNIMTNTFNLRKMSFY